MSGQTRMPTIDLSDEKTWEDEPNRGVALRRGALEKQGKRKQAFMPRMCHLYADKLTYFKGKTGKLAGEIPIGLGTEVMLGDTKEGLEMTVSAPLQGRTYLLRAVESRELRSWYKLLKLSVPTQIREGYLMRKEPSVGWVKRWVVVLSSKLIVYNSKENCPKFPYGEILFNHESRVFATQPQKEAQVHTPHQMVVQACTGGRRFRFAATDEKDLIDWMHDITMQVPHKVKAAYLEKTGPGGVTQGFKRRWFLLLSDRLVYYQNKADRQIKGEIRLCDGVTVQISNIDNLTNTFILTCPWGAVYHLQAKNERERWWWMQTLNECLRRKPFRSEVRQQ